MLRREPWLPAWPDGRPGQQFPREPSPTERVPGPSRRLDHAVLARSATCPGGSCDGPDPSRHRRGCASPGMTDGVRCSGNGVMCDVSVRAHQPPGPWMDKSRGGPQGLRSTTRRWSGRTPDQRSGTQVACHGSCPCDRARAARNVRPGTCGPRDRRPFGPPRRCHGRAGSDAGCTDADPLPRIAGRCGTRLCRPRTVSRPCGTRSGCGQRPCGTPG